MLDQEACVGLLEARHPRLLESASERGSGKDVFPAWSGHRARLLVVGLVPSKGIELGPGDGVERDFHVRDRTLGRQSTQRPQPEAVVACGDAGVGDERDDLSGLFTEPSSASRRVRGDAAPALATGRANRGVAHGFGEPRDQVVVREHAPARRTKPCGAGISK